MAEKITMERMQAARKKKGSIRAAGLRTEKKFFGPRGVFAKSGRTEHLKNPKQTFRSLAIGSVFIFSSERDEPMWQMVKGPWRKINTLHYEHIWDSRLKNVRVGKSDTTVYPISVDEEGRIAVNPGATPWYLGVTEQGGLEAKQTTSAVRQPWVRAYGPFVSKESLADYVEMRLDKDPRSVKGLMAAFYKSSKQKKNPGETWHRVKAQWAKGKRDRFKETTYAHGFWSGEKVAHEDSAQAAKRMRSNPITIIGNPPVPEPQFTSWSQVVTYLKQEGWAPLGKKHVAAFGRTVGSLYQVIQLEARAWRVLYRTFLTPGASPMLSLGTWKQLDVAMVSANRQANDWVGKKNPPSEVCANVEGVIYDRVVEIAAEKTGNHDLKGRWYHPFTKGSEVLALDNGDILIHSKRGKKLWKED